MSLSSIHPGTIGVVFFFTFFLGVLIWVFRPGSKKEYEEIANIPLDKDK